MRLRSRSMSHYIAVAGDLGSLFWPLILANLGIVALQITDTLMISELGTLEFAAAGLGGHLASLVILFCSGVCQIIAPKVSSAKEQTNPEKLPLEIIISGTCLALLVSLPFGLLFVDPGWILDATNQDPLLRSETIEFLVNFWPSIPIMTINVVAAGSLTALGRPKAVAIAMLGAIIANFLGNYALIFGHFGAPQLGVKGAAIASVFSATVQLAILVIALLHDTNLKQKVSFTRLARTIFIDPITLFPSGLPVGLILLVEVGFFTGITLLIGAQGKDYLAAHQVAINILTVTLMVSLAISQGMTVKVAALAVTRNKKRLHASIHMGMLINLTFMVVAAITIFLLAEQIVSLFVAANSPIGSLAKNLLLLIALFQVLDGIQTVATGILRGFDDTKVPLLLTMFCYWIIGLPAAFVAATLVSRAVEAIWITTAVVMACLALTLCIRLKNLLSDQHKIASQASGSN